MTGCPALPTDPLPLLLPLFTVSDTPPTPSTFSGGVYCLSPPRGQGPGPFLGVALVPAKAVTTCTVKSELAKGFGAREPSNTQALSVPVLSRCDSGYTLVHPFRALGKNSELLLVSDERDVATWQKRRLALHWASGPPARTETEANHIRFVQPGPLGARPDLREASRELGPTGTWHPTVHQSRLLCR